MTAYEVGMFKYFLTNNGIESVFINMYKTNRLKANPQSIEDYLFKVDAEKVCLCGFYFYIQNKETNKPQVDKFRRMATYEYWFNKQETFNSYLDSSFDAGHAEKWYQLRDNDRKYLAQNWDKRDYWRFEKRKDAIRRVSKYVELPQEAIDYLNTPDEPETETNDVAVPEVTEQTVTVTNDAPVEETRNDDIFGEFEFVDVTTKRHNGSRLKENQVSVSTKDDAGRLTFSQKLSEYIRKCGNFKYASIMTRKDGTVLLFLNNQKGASVCDGISAKGSDKNRNVRITSKGLVQSLCELLGVKEEYTFLTVKEYAKTSDYLAYQVIND